MLFRPVVCGRNSRGTDGRLLPLRNICHGNVYSRNADLSLWNTTGWNLFSQPSFACFLFHRRWLIIIVITGNVLISKSIWKDDAEYQMLVESISSMRDSQFKDLLAVLQLESSPIILDIVHC